ncbi:MAG: DegQ family serine endoprotease [Verrucomicrobiota bacterium]
MKKIFFISGFLSVFFVLGANAFWPFDGEKKPAEEKPKPVAEKPTTSVQVNHEPLDRQSRLTTSFAPVIKNIAPGVVSVITTKNTNTGSQPFPYFNDPQFKRFFPDDMDPQTPQSHRDREIGSGVIVSADGYIITNNHVIEDAEEITISLGSNEREVPAKIIGIDPKTDLAVLKVDRTNLPAVTFADSDKIEVGDIVLAIGNPFGLSQTVTMGIISALGRDNIGIVQDGYEDFIQTDASINPGNSGGALIDAEGRVIGINTAIYSQSGGNQGIGFAVPINFVRSIMEQIIKNGRVIRGYVGISIQPLSKELAEAFKIPEATGALIGEVTPGSPAAEVGLKEGDVIVEFNGEKVTNPHQLRLTIAQTKPGVQIRFRVIRDGKLKEFPLTLKELPDEEPKKEAVADSAGRNMLDGIEVTDLDARTRKQLNIPEKIQGALVKNVAPGSAAFDVGVRPGDIIMEIDRQAIYDANNALDISKKIEGDRVVLRIWRNNARYVVLPIRKKDAK